MKTILCLVFVVLAPASLKADQAVFATSGTGTVQVAQSVSSTAHISFQFANGSMAITSDDATVSTHCNQVGCLPGTTVSVNVGAGFTTFGSFPDFVSITLDGVTHTCNSSSVCGGSFALASTVTIPLDGGTVPSGFFSVTVPFTMTGVVSGFGETFLISGSGFASFDLARPDLGYIVPGSIQYAFTTPEPGSMVLLVSGLFGMGFRLRQRMTN